MAERRAGGYVDRGDGKGWVLDEPRPLPKPVGPRQVSSPVRTEPYKAGGWTFTPDPEPSAPEPAQSEEKPTPKLADVRAWAKEQGIDVPARGKVPDDVLDQYLNRET